MKLMVENMNPKPSLSPLQFLLIDFISGSEAMFADLCYFSVRSVQVIMPKKKKRWIKHCYTFLLICYISALLLLLFSLVAF